MTRTLVRRLGRCLIVLACGAGLASCGTGGSTVSLGQSTWAGAPLEMPPRLADEACDPILREAPERTLNARHFLGSTLDPPLAATVEAAAGAARDPAADVFTYGIPLTQAELAAVRGAGVVIDPQIPMATQMGGGPVHMIDTSLQTGVLTVTMDAVDDPSLARIQCFEPLAARGQVLYRSAHPDREQLDAALGQVRGDVESLRSDGVTVTDVWLDAGTERIVVELAPYSSSAAGRLAGRYAFPLEIRPDNGIPGS